jgi:hypothetical protein
MSKDVNTAAEKARWASAVRRTLWGMVILVTASQTALAASTTLVCSTGNPREASPTTIDLNEAQSSVTIHFGSTQCPGCTPDPIPGRTAGPLTAKFAKNAITFAERPDSRSFDYTINRLTGIVGVNETQQGQPYHTDWTCHVGKPQF